MKFATTTTYTIFASLNGIFTTSELYIHFLEYWPAYYFSATEASPRGHLHIFLKLIINDAEELYTFCTTTTCDSFNIAPANKDYRIIFTSFLTVVQRIFAPTESRQWSSTKPKFHNGTWRFYENRCTQGDCIRGISPLPLANCPNHDRRCCRIWLKFHVGVLPVIDTLSTMRVFYEQMATLLNTDNFCDLLRMG